MPSLHPACLPASSVLVDAEQAHLMEHGQLGDRDGHQGQEVDAEVERVVLRVETRQDVPVRGKRKGRRN